MECESEIYQQKILAVPIHTIQFSTIHKRDIFVARICISWFCDTRQGFQIIIIFHVQVKIDYFNFSNTKSS